MSEPSTPSEPPPSSPAVPSPARRGHNWHRIRVYFWSIVLCVTMWFCASIISIRQHPEQFVRSAFAQLPFPASVDKVYWINRRTLILENVKLGDFFWSWRIVITASPSGLLRHHIAKVQVQGGQLFTKPLYAEMDRQAALVTPPPKDPLSILWASIDDLFSRILFGTSEKGAGIDWTIARLEISRGTVMFYSEAVDISVPVRLGIRRPIVLYDIKLGKPDESESMTRERVEDIENVYIVSPFDPVAPVFSFPLIRLTFTYKELWHHQLRNVQLVRPTMFLGEDLFWFTDQFRKERKSMPATGVTAPWHVDEFEVQYGQLAVSAFGQPVVHFPFFFETKASDIRLDQLDKLSVKSAIKIKRLDQDYPDYKLRLVGLTGQLYFSLPPTDDKANNVVNTIAIDEVSWNDIPVTKVGSTVTFDPNGIYGKIYGACEGGQLSGNFEFYYTKGFTWNVDLFAEKINCQPVAEKVAGKYFNLTGELDGKVSVQGKVTEIQSCKGLLSLPHAGLLEIKSLDTLMKNLPAKPTLLKEQAMKIAVESFRSYPYEKGDFKVDYTPASGSAILSLTSTHGDRHFDIYWHPHPSAEEETESSKVAKTADNH